MAENIKNYKNLLKVFAELRKYGIIKNGAIKDWADDILSLEEVSEYEFIEISTTNSTHDLITILDRNSQNADMEIVCRAMLGILYHLLNTKSLEFKKALKIICEISYEERLTKDEQYLLYGFSEYSMYDFDGPYEGLRLFKEDLIKLLKIYESFTLSNYNEWQIKNEILQYELDKELDSIKLNYPY
ncbi:hypothetical protein QF023_000041 [Chryseobacterium sp. SLBN-27]|uniref:hypothetical protein n=1 Tax=Chryseobacterium TaxID=59732 RepID=UPI0028638DE0|nr:hypothetical protein [Chryseobacterium sp. SLBN-27]MDR6156525.1 hypothetical protein [Chryseobacterium sp. SLBN-27]